MARCQRLCTFNSTTAQGRTRTQRSRPIFVGSSNVVSATPSKSPIFQWAILTTSVTSWPVAWRLEYGGLVHTRLPLFCRCCAGASPPPPHVELLNAVANVVGMLNPGGRRRWTGAPVRFFEGILGLAFDDGQEAGEGDDAPSRHTTTLHFKIARAHDMTGNLVPTVTCKSRYDDMLWSEPFRPFKDCPSGLSLSNIPKMKIKNLPEARMVMLESALNSSRFRVSTEEHKSNLRELRILQDGERHAFHWCDDGKFQCELEGFGESLSGDDDDDDDDDLLALEMPGEAPVTTVHGQRERRRLHKRGAAPAQTAVIVGNFIVFYVLPDPKARVKRRFGVGKVTRIIDQRSVEVHWWNSTDKTHFRGWKVWSGRGKSQAIQRHHIILARSEEHFFMAKRGSGRRSRGSAINLSLRPLINSGVHRMQANDGESGAAPDSDDEVLNFCQEDVALEEVEDFG